MADQRNPDVSGLDWDKKARSSVQSCSSSWVELDHGTEYPDDHAQVEPAAKTPYRITFGDGSWQVGVLDQNGFARFDDIPPGQVDVEYEPDLDTKIAELKKQLKQGLAEIVEAEREESRRIEKNLEEARVFGWEFTGSNSIAKSGIYAGAFIKGIGRGALGILEFAWEVLSGSGKALYELSLRLNPITAPQKFKEDLQALKDTYQALQRFADEDLEAYAVLMGDPSTYSLLWQFGQDFLSAQHSLEITEGGGELAFDVILAVITAGAGAVASSRHAAKLKKLKTVVDELVDSLKSKKRRQRTRREPPNRRITTRVQLKHVPCFCPYNGKGYRRLSPHERKDYLQEYDRQLRRQQDALNNMTVDEYLTAREAYARHGRNPVADTMQENARDDFRSDVVGSITKSLRRQNPSLGAAEITRQANARADSLLDKLAALHEPDMVAGGWSDPMPKGMGDSAVNSASGASWNQKDRLSSVDEQATQARTAGQGQEKMNVKLEVCRGKRHCP